MADCVNQHCKTRQPTSSDCVQTRPFSLHAWGSSGVFEGLIGKEIATSRHMIEQTATVKFPSLEYLFLELEVEVSTVLLELSFPLGCLLPGQLQAQLPIGLERADVVLLLIQQVLHLLLVHLQPPRSRVMPRQCGRGRTGGGGGGESKGRVSSGRAGDWGKGGGVGQGSRGLTGRGGEGGRLCKARRQDGNKEGGGPDGGSGVCKSRGVWHKRWVVCYVW